MRYPNPFAVGIGILVVLLVLMSFGQIAPSRLTGDTPATRYMTTTALPEPVDYAVDTANALTPEQLSQLRALLKMSDIAKHQFAVAIIPTTGDTPIEQYSIALAEKWKVGHAGNDDGAIIVIATQDRTVRIEVGKGLEGDITDAIAGNIIRNDMAPLLKEGKWYDAVVVGINSLASKRK